MRFSSGLALSSTSPPGSIASRTAATSPLNAVTFATSSRRIGKSSPARADAGARLIDRVDEVGDHAQLQRLERPALHVERVERIGQRFAGAQRKQRMPLEELDRLAGRRLRGDDDLRIGRRLELRQRRRRRAASARAR